MHKGKPVDINTSNKTKSKTGMRPWERSKKAQEQTKGKGPQAEETPSHLRGDKGGKRLKPRKAHNLEGAHPRSRKISRNRSHTKSMETPKPRSPKKGGKNEAPKKPPKRKGYSSYRCQTRGEAEGRGRLSVETGAFQSKSTKSRQNPGKKQ